MKKLYIEPEFEIVNVSLLTDVLGTSQIVDESTVPDYGGGDFDPNEGF